MSLKPLVIDAGQIKQLPSGESIDVGGWTLPSSGGAEDQLLQADASGNAQWVDPPDTWDWSAPLGANMVLVSTGMGTVGWELKPFFYNANAPTADDQVFISNGASSAAWVTAGNNQVLASDAGGELAFEDKPFGYKLAPPTAPYQFLQATGSGSASWTSTPTLGGNLDVNGQVITTGLTNGDIVIEPNGTGALQRMSTGNARGSYAVDWQCLRADLADVASGYCSVIAGGEDNTATNTHAVVGGGYANTASGDYAVVAGGDTNTASGARAAIGGGDGNTASAAHATIGGGLNNEATDLYATVAGGRSNDATGDYNSVGGGYGNLAQGSYYNVICGGHTNQITGAWSTIGGGYDNGTGYNYVAIAGGGENSVGAHYGSCPGGRQAWIRHYGAFCHASGCFTAKGDAQRNVFLARRTTASTSQVELFLDGDGGTKRMHILYGHTWYYTIKILATKKNSMQNSYAEKIEGIITRATGGTQMVAGPVQIRTLGASLGAITVDADDPTDTLRIRVTPNTTDEIWWLAHVDVVHINGYVAA